MESPNISMLMKMQKKNESPLQSMSREQLMERIAFLCWEKNIIRGRVALQLQLLIYQNEELKAKTAELEAKLEARTQQEEKISSSLSSTTTTTSTVTISQSMSSANLTSKESRKWTDKVKQTVKRKNLFPSASRTNLQYSSMAKNASKESISEDEKEDIVGCAGKHPPNNNEEVENESGNCSSPAAAATATTVESEEFSFFEEDSKDLLFVKQKGISSMPTVKAATPEKLIERLVPEKYPDPNYLSHFLLTYRSFTTPDKILEILENLFNAPQSPAGSVDDPEFVKNRNTVRLRIVNVLKTWLGRKHCFDLIGEESNPKIIEKIRRFIQLIEDSGLKSHADLLKHSLEKLKSNEEVNFVSTQKAPEPIILVNVTDSSTLTLTDIDPVELARQITLIEFDLFKKILPKECLKQSWTKAGKEQNSPNVLKMIHWSNDVSAWVQSEVLKRENPKLRTDIIKLFIKTAKSCKDMSNYSTIFEIIAGLESSAVNRLKKTWERVEKSIQRIYQDLQELTSQAKNFQILRSTLKQSLPPCIPYLGMFLTDLTFIDDGNPERIESEHYPEGLINFIKLRKTALIIKDIQHFQQTGYPNQVVPPIKQFLLNMTSNTINPDEAYRISLQLEPRESLQ